MAKLYFRHGAMAASKTLNLLAVAHNYRAQGKRVLLLKPRLDSRYGTASIRSRAGLDAPADILLDADTVLDAAAFEGLDCVLVDEAQFLSAAVIEQLRVLTRTAGVPVICYGLRTDFATRLFEGSRRLLELADTIEEIKVTCELCNRKAVMNMRYDSSGVPVREGSQVCLGDASYSPLCFPCFHAALPETFAAPAGVVGAGACKQAGVEGERTLVGMVAGGAPPSP